MKSRLRQAFQDGRVLVEDMPKILNGRSDDTTTARGADDEVKRAIFEKLDDGRGDGRERPFARLDEIGRRGLVAKGV